MRTPRFLLFWVLGAITISGCYADSAPVGPIWPPDNPTWELVEDWADTTWWQQAAINNLHINSAQMLPINLHPGTTAMWSVSSMNFTYVPVVVSTETRIDVAWLADNHTHFDQDTSWEPSLFGEYVYTSDSSLKCSEVDSFVTATGSGVVKWKPSQFPASALPFLAITKQRTTNVRERDCRTPEPPPPPDPGGPVDDCEMNFQFGGDNVAGLSSEGCEGWVCEWVDWGLFYWNGWTWVLIDIWEEEECYWGNEPH